MRTKRYDWVAIVDDDSFVFPRALQRLLQRYDSSRAYYFGDFLGDDALTFACGGAGSLLSRGAMARMNLISCIRTMHPKCMQSDWMIGKCAARAQVEPVTEHGCTCTGDGRGIREWMLRGSTPPSNDSQAATPTGSNGPRLCGAGETVARDVVCVASSNSIQDTAEY